VAPDKPSDWSHHIFSELYVTFSSEPDHLIYSFIHDHLRYFIFSGELGPLLRKLKVK
jgi:hypothetical protein